jgi:hypothetical protein
LSSDFSPQKKNVIKYFLSLNFADVQSSRWNEKAFAAILVLAFFKERLANLQDDWELIADKSRIWILQTVPQHADAMFEVAVKIIK